MTTTQQLPATRRVRGSAPNAGVLALALLVGTLASAGQPSRFSGSGSLSVATAQTSANQRFSLSAELQAAPAPEKASSDGRFALNAALAANKALATWERPAYAVALVARLRRPR